MPMEARRCHMTTSPVRRALAQGGETMGRARRGGPPALVLHADAARALAEADYPARVKQTILMALRGGRPGKQVCLAWGKVAQHCQFWVPQELTQVTPDPTAKPAVYW